MAGEGTLLQRLLRRPATPEEPLLARVRAAGGRFERVVFTRNRRVMASVGEGGRVLRLHECFRAAPDAVLDALGALFGSASQRERARAREAVQHFLRENPPPAPRRRARRVAPADRVHLERLQAEFDHVNATHFAGQLPRVPLALSGRMRRRNGHFSTHPLEIVLSRALCTDAVEGEAERTLRHEMIHLWQHVQGTRPDHGAEFRRWARRLGVHPRASRAVEWKCA